MGNQSYDVNTYKPEKDEKLRPNQQRPMELRTINRRLSQVPSSGDSPSGTFEPVNPELLKTYNQQNVDGCDSQGRSNGTYYPPEFAPKKKRGKCLNCMIGNLLLLLALLVMLTIFVGLYYGGILSSSFLFGTSEQMDSSSTTAPIDKEEKQSSTFPPNITYSTTSKSSHVTTSLPIQYDHSSSTTSTRTPLITETSISSSSTASPVPTTTSSSSTITLSVTTTSGISTPTIQHPATLTNAINVLDLSSTLYTDNVTTSTLSTPSSEKYTMSNVSLLSTIDFNTSVMDAETSTMETSTIFLSSTAGSAYDNTTDATVSVNTTTDDSDTISVNVTDSLSLSTTNVTENSTDSLSSFTSIFLTSTSSANNNNISVSASTSLESTGSDSSISTTYTDSSVFENTSVLFFDLSNSTMESTANETRADNDTDLFTTNYLLSNLTSTLATDNSEPSTILSSPSTTLDSNISETDSFSINSSDTEISLQNATMLSDSNTTDITTSAQENETVLVTNLTSTMEYQNDSWVPELATEANASEYSIFVSQLPELDATELELNESTATTGISLLNFTDYNFVQNDTNATTVFDEDPINRTNLTLSENVQINETNHGITNSDLIDYNLTLSTQNDDNVSVALVPVITERVVGNFSTDFPAINDSQTNMLNSSEISTHSITPTTVGIPENDTHQKDLDDSDRHYYVDEDIFATTSSTSKHVDQQHTDGDTMGYDYNEHYSEYK